MMEFRRRRGDVSMIFFNGWLLVSNTLKLIDNIVLFFMEFENEEFKNSLLIFINISLLLIIKIIGIRMILVILTSTFVTLNDHNFIIHQNLIISLIFWDGRLRLYLHFLFSLIKCFTITSTIINNTYSNKYSSVTQIILKHSGNQII